MSLSVIDKYISKKSKDLLEYAKILESIISIEDNNLWHSKKDFTKYAKEVIENYADNYYFQNNIHKDNPIEYSNDNINFVLKAILEYCRLHDTIDIVKLRKNETFLLSVIICSACYVDFACNAVDGDYQDTKNKFKYLLSYLRKTKVLNVKDNKYFVNDLFEAIKKNAAEDKKILSGLESEAFKNTYKMLSNNPVIYDVSYTYSIPDLENFDENLSKRVLATYENKFFEMSLDVLELKILEELISNKEMPTYVIRVNKYLKKANIVRKLNKKYLKDNIKILIPFEHEVEYQTNIKDLKEIGMSFIYELEETKNIEATIFMDNTEVLVDKEFIKNNLDNENNFKKMNVKLIVKNKED